jgi:cytochrome c biogenesis protein CcmG, thiol:disulfide interchange protein DsbE
VPRRSATLAAVALLAAALVGLLVYGVAGTADNTTLDDAVKRGERPAAPAGDRRLPRLDGRGSLSLGELEGKVVVLNFWASWCDPCRAEAPLLQDAHRALQRGGAGTVLGVTYNDTDSDSRAFEREFELSYPSLRDVGTELAEEFGTRALPETFVLDRRGRVVAVARGQLDRKFLDNAIAKARS